jgi:hypothetical protein
MHHCSKQVGDAYFRTPRNTIIAFVSLLAVLEQNRSVDWRELIGKIELKADTDLSAVTHEETPTALNKAPEDRVPDATQGTDDDLASFKL